MNERARHINEVEELLYAMKATSYKSDMNPEANIPSVYSLFAFCL